MNDILSLTEYAKEIRTHKNDPRTLADLQIEMAAKFAMLTDIAKDVMLEKAEFETNIKFAGEKPLSDAAVESKWRITEGGKKELRLRYELRGLLQLISACKSSIVVSSNEAKNYS